MPSLSALYLLLLATLLFSACSPMPLSTLTPDSEQAQQEHIDESAEALLEKAQSLASPERDHLLIKAAKIHTAENNYQGAITALKQVNTEQLSHQKLMAFSLIYSDALRGLGKHFAALDLLTHPHLTNVSGQVPVDQQLLWQYKRAELFALLGKTQRAAKEYIALTRLLTAPEEISAVHEKIWQQLIHTPDETLIALEKTAATRSLKGWYNLALIGRQYQGDIRQWSEQLVKWRAQWPEHPAVLFPPSSQQEIEQAAHKVPGQIALLLPLSGKYARAGRTIRDGFLAAYYNSLENKGSAAPLHIYDTHESEIAKLYQQALNAGAEIVIGPLRKENLAALAGLAELPAPVIGLNYLNKTDQHLSSNHDNLLQFGLSVEDEARQIAQRAWLEGHRSALLITPDTRWANTAKKAFQAHWTKLGGHVVTTPPYKLEQVDFSATIKSALLIEQSQKRAKRLQSTLGKKIALSARRRQDIDMIFVIAYPNQGRQIKPTLDFYYANDLSTYATSHIYTGTQNKIRNSDLEDIRFTAMPWTVPGAVSDKLKPSKTLQSTYRNLFALGIDAYQLHQWLDVMHRNPETLFYGHTGTLNMNAQGRIQHNYPWAEFYRGEVRLSPTLRNKR